VQLTANLEHVALHDYELDANEAHMNCSTSSSSKVACFVFQCFFVEIIEVVTPADVDFLI
jgi:hypothetical protein